MDPNLFHLDWERTLEALVAIMVLAFFVERGCALIFESRWYISRFEDRRVAKPIPGDAPVVEGAAEGEAQAAPLAPPSAQPRTRNWPLKEIVAFGVAAAVCLVWDFDAVSMIILRDETHLVGKLVTAAVIAGGSKASVKLFQDLMKVRSSANEERKKFKEGGAP